MRGSSKIQLNSAKVATATAVAPRRESPKARAVSRKAAGAEQPPNGAGTLPPAVLGAGANGLSDPRLVETGHVALAL